MKLTTSNGKTYEVDWIDGATVTDGRLWMQMSDDRRLPEIANEFDGLEWMEKESEHTGITRYEGWSMVSMIKRESKEKVQIAFVKEGAENA
jgi:hypothetical protein